MFTFFPSRTRTGATPLSLVSLTVFVEQSQKTHRVFVGEQWTDTVSLGPGLTVTGQSIGVAETSSGFQGVDGILG